MTENFITFMSTTVPILAQILNRFITIFDWNVLATFVIGIIQLCCGFSIFIKNLRSVQQWEIGARRLQDITKLAMQIKDVEKISDQSGIFVGMEEFKYSADVTYDLKMIADEILRENEDLLDQIVFSPAYQDRMYLLREFVEDVPRAILKKIEQKNLQIEQLIRNKIPQCVDVDIEPEHKELLYWDDLDKSRVIGKIRVGEVDGVLRELLEGDVEIVVLGQRRAGVDGLIAEIDGIIGK